MAFLIAAAIVALYSWLLFAENPNISNLLIVNKPTAILAGITVMVSLVSYIWSPKKLIFPTALVTYLFIVVTTAALIFTTGSSASPFIALWMLVVVFTRIFGLWGSLSILIITSVFTASQYISGDLTNEVAIIVAFSSLLPLVASFIVWHDDLGDNNPSDDSREYRNLANELSEVASKSEVVINAIGDGVVAIDSKGTIQLINPAAQNIIGWGKQDALSLDYKSVMRFVNQKGELIDVTNDPIQQVLNINQQVRTNDLAFTTKGGKKLMISLVVSPVGEVGSGVIAVFRDITKEKDEERGQAEFISTASHEMRTPVASIEGYLGLVLNPQTATIDARARDFILKAHESAEHLGHLFQDLLDISKADDGRLSNNPKVIEIVEFTHDVVQGLQQKAILKGLSLIFKPLPENAIERHITPVYSVNLDNNHIREIINNLVENAIKYTLTGEIEVDVTGDDDHVVISVKDSGIGILAEDISHLFQKFYRIDNKDTREIGGTGLGLYLCRRLAEIMGGRIWAESVYGNGSTFYVELPRISNEEATRLAKGEAIKSKQESEKIAEARTREMTVSSSPTETTSTSSSSTPYVGGLTPEQIAEYVAKQRALIKQQTPPKTSVRPQSISIPVRVVNKKQ